MPDLLAGIVDIKWDAQGGQTLTQQLYLRLQRAILAGALPPGLRLPSSRDMAERLKISRNIVSGVIDQLGMEGYLDVARGRRPVVAAAPVIAPTVQASVKRRRPVRFSVSHWAERVRAAEWPLPATERPRAFAPGFADAREFPHDLWARCLRRAARQVMGRPSSGINRPALRQALLRHLREYRGVNAEAQQIVITPSAQSAIELVARLILNPGDGAWVESPGYGGAHAAFEAAGARVSGVRLDESGLSLQGRSDRPRLIFVTPSHQYPTGRLMPIARRQQLLSLAASAGAQIVEDDYDSEFHYDGRPVAALQGLASSDSVFYIGTFSKSTFADIRVGYAVVPENLAALFERAQRHSGQIVSPPLQDALAEFIDDGHYAGHIRKMTRIYRARRDRLVQALRADVGDVLRVDPPPGGMQLSAYLAPGLDDRHVSSLLEQAGVAARPLSHHFTSRVTQPGLFLGFAAWNEQEINAGAARMGKVLRKLGYR